MGTLAIGKAGAINAALAAKESGEKKVILVGVCGHGNFDMVSYEKYLAGQLEDYDYPAEKIAEAMAHLPQVAAG